MYVLCMCGSHCVYTYTYGRAHTYCTYIHIYVHIYTFHTYTYQHKKNTLHTGNWTSIYMCMYICTQANIHTHIYTYVSTLLVWTRFSACLHSKMIVLFFFSLSNHKINYSGFLLPVYYIFFTYKSTFLVCDTHIILDCWIWPLLLILSETCRHVVQKKDVCAVSFSLFFDWLVDASTPS